MAELKTRKFVDGLVAKIAGIYKEGLVSVVVYGSAASGEFSDTRSNINLLVVLQDTSLLNISRSCRLLGSYKYRRIKPLFMTEDYIAASTDVFPIEFLDIKESGTVLYGKDVLKGMDINLRNLRFQCEQELKSRIVMIKSAYSRNVSRKVLEDLLMAMFTSSVHIFRNSLRLKGVVPPYHKDKVIDLVEKEFLVDCKGLRRILEAKSRGRSLSHAEIDNMLNELVGAIEAVSKMVNDLDAKITG